MADASDANLYSAFEARFRTSAGREAFIVAGRPSVSYGELAAAVGRMANALAALGVRQGDRVTVQVEKSIPNVVLYLACLKHGAVFNPLNTAYTAAELAYFIGDAEPALVVASAAMLSAMAGTLQANGVRASASLDADGTGTLTELAAGQSDTHVTAPCKADDLAALLYTSGTTGRSKGAMLTHDNLASNARTLHTYWRFQPDDVLIHALPIFHVHGLFVALNTTFLNGSPMRWMDKFDALAVLAAMPGATVLMGVPTFYTRLLSLPGLDADACRTMRLFVSGSAPLLAETHVAFAERTGHAILERYGMTETGMITSNPYDGDRIAGTVGYPLPGISVRLATQAGADVPTGEVGVLEVNGPNVFKGYWRNPEKTAEEFRPGGWFITGDLATQAPDGRVTIVGRAKDLIISGGFNVYPKEVEDEINDMPGVLEAAVIGVAHPDFGEGVVAVIAPQPGGRLAPEAEIIAHLATRLAKFKCPKRVYVVDDLPRNTMGKVQKAELRHRYRDTFKA